MDIKDLNKSQLILLAVLLSFITSIATGITTVTLMQQAPTSFTAPVNRVIQQTVEKIQQVEGKTTVQTVIIKEEDLVVDAIEKNRSAIFTITKDGQDANFSPAEVPAGYGFALSKEGIIVADLSLVPEGGVYYASNESGKFKAFFLSGSENGFAFMKVGVPVNEKDKLSFTVPNFGSLEKMKRGQKILVLGSGVSSFIFDGNKDIKSSIDKKDAGAAVLDLDGNVLGMVLAKENAAFGSIDTINKDLKLSLNLPETMTAGAVLAPSL